MLGERCVWDTVHFISFCYEAKTSPGHKGAGAMAQQLNPLSALLASHIGAPVQVAAAPLLSQLLANAPKEVLEDGPKACAPCHLNRRASYSSWLLTPISPQSRLLWPTR